MSAHPVEREYREPSNSTPTGGFDGDAFYDPIGADMAAAEAQPKPMTTMGEHFIGVIAGIWHEHPEYSIRQTLDALNAKWPSAQPGGEPVAPMFWVRLCSDGLYEGPIHNARIEEVRQQSGAWSPLYLGAPPAQPAARPLTDAQIKNAIVPIAADHPSVYLALCYESGPYCITELRAVAVSIVRAIERAHGIGSQP